jgi:hypothetical protein
MSVSRLILLQEGQHESISTILSLGVFSQRHSLSSDVLHGRRRNWDPLCARPPLVAHGGCPVYPRVTCVFDSHSEVRENNRKEEEMFPQILTIIFNLVILVLLVALAFSALSSVSNGDFAHAARAGGLALVTLLVAAIVSFVVSREYLVATGATCMLLIVGLSIYWSRRSTFAKSGLPQK